MIKDVINIIKLLDDSIKEDAINNITDWEIIADNYDDRIDEYRQTILNANNWLTEYQNLLKQKYNITTLKIKVTNISWYFIEIPKTQISKIDESFIHKQTLVNANRYITNELKDYEQKIIEANEQKSNLEYELFLNIRDQVLSKADNIIELSYNISFIDFISSQAYVSDLYNFNRPELTESFDLNIKSARHPIIENSVDDFISNDLNLNKSEFIHIITWPNMWWKSTFLRQNALIILLSHIWLNVPAKNAKIPITDRIFTRIWAWDNLVLGQSTFMIEMQEVANILNNATNKSFIIIDEVWRWTSTFDWMSLAWSILKEIHDNIWAKTLFSTHYHELIDESIKLKKVKNFSVAVWENEENLVFLRKIISWWIKKSFWLEVARIAGISDNTIKEAKKMLQIMEQKEQTKFATQLRFTDNFEPHNRQKDKENENYTEIKGILDKTNINELTPIMALNLINKIKWKIK